MITNDDQGVVVLETWKAGGEQVGLREYGNTRTRTGRRKKKRKKEKKEKKERRKKEEEEEATFKIEFSSVDIDLLD